MTSRFKTKDGGDLRNLLLPKFRAGDHVLVNVPGRPQYKAIVREVHPDTDPDVKGFMCRVAVPVKSKSGEPEDTRISDVVEDYVEPARYDPLVIKCSCGFEFTLSREGQKFYFERGFVLPKRCKKCRDEKKAKGA